MLSVHISHSFGGLRDQTSPSIPHTHMLCSLPLEHHRYPYIYNYIYSSVYFFLLGHKLLIDNDFLICPWSFMSSSMLRIICLKNVRQTEFILLKVHLILASDCDSLEMAKWIDMNGFLFVCFLTNFSFRYFGGLVTNMTAVVWISAIFVLFCNIISISH